MFERQKVPIFGFCFHLISKTIEISIVDSYEFESKKTNKKWHCSILHHLFRLQRYSITCRCQLRRLALIGFVAVSIYRVRYTVYSTVQTYGTGIRYVQTNDAYICVQITEPIYPTEIWYTYVCTVHCTYGADKRISHSVQTYRIRYIHMYWIKKKSEKVLEVIWHTWRG